MSQMHNWFYERISRVSCDELIILSRVRVDLSVMIVVIV